MKPPIPDSFLSEGDLIKIDNDELECIHVPGHSPGSLVFLNRAGKFLISGDVLFKESIGRSDLPKDNHEKLIEGITSKLFILDDDIIVYPGHGEPTTIGYEKINNPFFQSY
jgi:glyoxylase-like metal-dependent hydrolase (beta-lactamase superfamily II)